MKRYIKNIIFPTAVLLFFAQALILSGCSDWTETEAKDYFEHVTPEYKANLKQYYNSPHKLMFGWFGNWAGKSGSSMQYSLMGLPDSVDFVSLWLCWGNLTEAQQVDLKEFQDRGSRAVLCWLPTAIGENITPGGNSIENLEQFWGFDRNDVDSRVEAAKKYALAIVDTINKYNIDGFDADIESTGTLIDTRNPQVFNTFLRTLREEFNKTGKMLVCDIPGGSGWLSYYDILDDDVVDMVDYFVWQTYEISGTNLDNFFCGNSGSVKSHKPELFEKVLRKSIVTATFERSADKHYFLEQSEYRSSVGIDHAGQGAYHIEYDYPGNPDYATVRKGIATQNPPIKK